MTNGDQQRLEFEIAVRDSMSAVLKTIGRELDTINRKLIETGAVGDNSLEKIRKHFLNLNDSSGRSANSIQEIDKRLVGLGKNLLGPIGLAAGFVAVAKSLDSFAVSQLQLTNLATNTGFAASKIDEFTLKASRAGIDLTETTSAIAGMGAKFNDMIIRPYANNFYNAIAQTNPKLANQLQLLANIGDREAFNQKIVDAWIKETNPAVRRYYEQVSGYSAAYFQAQERDLTGAVKIWRGSADAARAYHEVMTNIETRLGNIWSHTAMRVILQFEQDPKKRARWKWELEGNVGPYWEGPDEGGPEERAGKVSRRKSGFGLEQIEKSPGGSWLKRWWKKSSLISGAEAAESDQGDGTIEISAKAYRREEFEIEQDTNKLLRDIRDVMGKLEINTQGFSTSSGYPPGQARRAILEGRGPGGPKPGGPTQPISTEPNQYGQTSLAPNTLAQIGRGLGALPSAAPGGHQGGDYMVPEGTPLSAPDNVKVLRAGNFGPSAGFGIEWRDSNGAIVKIFHLREDPKSIGIVPGESYDRGFILGNAGRTGNAAGGEAHFHVEVRREGKIVSPHEYFWGGARPGIKVAPADQLKGPGIVAGSIYGTPGDKYLGPYGMRTATGGHVDEGGIALRNKGTLGQTFEVTDLESGRKAILKQNDLGPFVKGRGIDFSPGAARALGLPESERGFPTGRRFRVVRVGETDGQTVAGGISAGSKFRENWQREGRSRARNEASMAQIMAVMRKNEAENELKRKQLDGSLQKTGGIAKNGKAAVDVDFSGMDKKSAWEGGKADPFIDLGFRKTPQAGQAGGGVDTFNRFAFE